MYKVTTIKENYLFKYVSLNVLYCLFKKLYNNYFNRNTNNAFKQQKSEVNYK